MRERINTNFAQKFNLIIIINLKLPLMQSIRMIEKKGLALFLLGVM